MSVHTVSKIVLSYATEMETTPFHQISTPNRKPSSSPCWTPATPEATFRQIPETEILGTYNAAMDEVARNIPSKRQPLPSQLDKRVSLEVCRYDFSEPQYGKDVCDRILCPMKTCIRRFCNEGHDILSAGDMRRALSERPVKGTSACFFEVPFKSRDRKKDLIEQLMSFIQECQCFNEV